MRSAIGSCDLVAVTDRKRGGARMPTFAEGPTSSDPMAARFILGGVLAVPNYDDRATGVTYAVLADRAQQHADEGSVPAAAND